MSFPIKIQPLNQDAYGESELMKPSVVKSQLKRLFDRKVEKQLVELTSRTQFESSSMCLANMVQNFIELDNDKQLAAVKCERSRCNCFNAKSHDSSDDELDEYFDSFPGNSFADANGLLRSLIPCASVCERNLLADTSKIVDKNKSCKRKDELRAIVTEGLIIFNYDASICKSQWE